MTLKEIRVSPARILNWVLLSCILLMFFQVGFHRGPHKNVISYDVLEYYSYLPRTFIEGDPTLAHWPEKFSKVWVHPTEGGTGFSLKMSMGIALLQLPFFLLAHLAALLLGFPADGFSAPYEVGIFFSVLFYMGVGLMFLRKILERYFSQIAVCVTLLLVVVATNLEWYLVIRPGVSHTFTFAMSAALLWQVIRYHEEPASRRILLLGLLLGIISLIRPTNVLFGLLLVLYQVHSLATLRGKLGTWLSRPGHVLLLLAGILLVWTPQLLFWKATSGDWLHYSYRNEGFFFDRPHILRGLFGYRNGWLLYTPVMAIALMGLALVYRRYREWFWGISLVAAAFIYVALSWWCWWYVGYGNRSFMDLYAVLAIPLGAVVAWGLERKWRGAALGLLAAILLFLNVFQTMQAYLGIVHSSAMTKEAYWAVFLKLEKPDGYGKMLWGPDMEMAKKGLEVRKK